MEYSMKAYGALCGLETFKINGRDAYEDDFVDKWDHAPDDAEPYGCGDMQAEVKSAFPAILEKYGITEEEYTKIAEEVAETVSFGGCGWCV